MASGTIPNNGLYKGQGMFMSKAIFADEVTAFASNDNLNTAKFTVPGKYYSPSAAVGSTLSNKPAGENLFTMLVFNPFNSDTGQLGTATYQYRLRMVIGFGGNIYMQQCHCENNTTILYESWKKVTMS